MRTRIVNLFTGSALLLSSLAWTACDALLGPLPFESEVSGESGRDAGSGTSTGSTSLTFGTGGASSTSVTSGTGGASSSSGATDDARTTLDPCAPTTRLNEFAPGLRPGDETNMTSCSCTPEAPLCHAIYQLETTAVAPDRWHADIVFRKKGGEQLVQGTQYWILAGPFAPSCMDLETYETVLGPMVVAATTFEIPVHNIPLWPSQEAFEAAPVGSKRYLFVVSEGHDSPQWFGKKLWFQGEGTQFRKNCE